jgi:hypothetical protein
LEKNSEISHEHISDRDAKQGNAPPPVLSSGLIAGDRDRRFNSLIQFFVRSMMEGAGRDIEGYTAATVAEDGRD